MNKINIAINGFGRIGRLVFRAAINNPNINIVGINDLIDANYMSYMLRYDTTHGRFNGEVSVDGKDLVVNGNKIRVTSERDPANLNWSDINGDGIVSDYEQSPPGTHRKVTWDTGGTAGGSSGSGLFNDNGLLVGQLSGGNNDCVDPTTLSDCQIASNSNSCYEIVGCEWYNNQCVLATTTDFYGKFSHAFNDVSQWLDPANLGVTSLEGICGNCNTYDECNVCDGPGLNEYGCCNDETIDCTGNCGGTAVIDECGVCDGPGPEFECIDQYGFSKGLFCSEALCDEYLSDSTDPIPTQLFLGQNYPNPFNPTTVIEYGIPTLSNTNISLYDLQGRKLQTLVNSIHRPGYYEISLTLNNLYSGIYIVKIVSDNATQIRKIALVK